MSVFVSSCVCVRARVCRVLLLVGHLGKYRATVRVHTGDDRSASRVSVRGVAVVVVSRVSQSTTVGCDNTRETKRFPERPRNQCAVCARWLSVDSIVRAHDGPRTSVGCALKGRQVRLGQITRTHHSVEAVTVVGEGALRPTPHVRISACASSTTVICVWMGSVVR
jgi:hypothetical protein